MSDPRPPRAVVDQLLDMASTCLVVLSPRGEVRWANAAARTMLLDRTGSLDPELWGELGDRAGTAIEGPSVDLGFVRAPDRTGVTRLWHAVAAGGHNGLCVALQLEQPGREDLRRLVAFADLAGTLARVRSYRAAVGAVASHLAATLGVDFARVAMVDPDRRVLSAEHAEQADTPLARRWLEVPLDDVTPLAEAVRRRRAVHAGDPTAIARRFPSIAADVAHSGFAAVGAAPITGLDGRVEGAIGYASRVAGPSPDASVMLAVSELVGGSLARARRARHDAELAGSFQRLMLPSAIDNPAGWTIDAAYVPSGREGRAGGDWYDAFPVAESRQMIVVGDVVGHGPAASAAMGVLRTATRSLALSGVVEPAELLGRLDAMAGRLGLDRFATMSAAVIDTATGLGVLALAGHLPPTIRRSDGTVERPSPRPGPPIGSALPSQPATGSFQLDPGDVLVLYSDGLVEELGDLDEGFERLERALAAGPPRLRDLISEMTLSQPRDDVVVVALARSPSQAGWDVSAGSPSLSGPTAVRGRPTQSRPPPRCRPGW